MIVKSRNYILSELASNRNKFYHLALHDDGKVVSRYGRIGDAGQEATLGQGEALFDAKCREKEKKGYCEQKTLGSGETTASRVVTSSNLRQAARQQIATNSGEALELVEKLVAANVHSILESTSLRYDAQNGTFSTPLGLVTQDALDEARRYLRIIGDCVSQESYDDYRLLAAANNYLRLVPQNIGRTRKGVRDLYPDLRAVHAQNELLDKLATSLQLALTAPAITAPTLRGTASQGEGSKAEEQKEEKQRVFQAALHLIQTPNEFEGLNDKFKNTLNRNHVSAKLRLKRAYSVEIAAMKSAFEAKGKPLGNVMELWHGTGTSNILSILHSGFQIQPPSTAPITGKMFSDGAYFAIQSSKSLNYAHGYWSGTRHKTCFLFLCDVAVGKYQVPRGTTSQRPGRGFDSYWARPGVSGVQNDEIVVFDAKQINPRYLIEFGEA